jgi:Carboxypeptidase regulatory-like domain/TonB dependent receptor-like, beta-barrel
MKRWIPTWVAALGLASLVPLQAQTLTGSVNGSVSDPSGAPLPQARVFLSGRTGSRETTTGSAGEFRFPAVSPDSYELRVVADGFQPRRLERLEVHVGQQLTLSLELKIAGVAESVEVVAEAPVVDVTSAATNQVLTQDVLFNLPLSRRGEALLNLAPGINSHSGYGAGERVNNSLRLDGLETRDPGFGLPAVFFNYNLIEEVEVQGLGAPAEYGGFTGAVVNTVTRTGGNRLGGRFEALYTGRHLAADNVSARVAEENPLLAEPGIQTKALDFSAQLSGPIRRDRLFFLADFQYTESDTDPPGPRTLQTGQNVRFNGKLTWQPGPADHLNFGIQVGHSESGNVPTTTAVLVTDELAADSSSPEVFWNAEWRHLFGSRTFLEAKYLGVASNEEILSKTRAPSHRDLATGENSVSAGFDNRHELGRHQASLALSHFSDAFLGSHEFKFGVELERSNARDLFQLIDGLTYFDYYNYAYLAYSYGYDTRGRNRRESVYAQDSWKPSDRLTVNAGLRFDWIRGRDSDGNQPFETKSLAPRIGIAYDLTGDHRTVLKASYGQYYEAALSLFYRQALPGNFDTVYYDATGPELVETDRVPSVLAVAAEGLNHPRVDELTAGFERALTPDLRLSITGVRRVYKNFISTLRPDARWEPIQITDELTGQPLTVYRWENRFTSQDVPIISNVNAVDFLDENGELIGTAGAKRDYHSLTIALSKRLSDRWLANVSYVLSHARGTQDNDVGNSTGALQNFQSATRVLVNAEGDATNDRRHELKIIASYEIPKIDVLLSVYYRALSGRNYTPLQVPAFRVTNSVGQVLLEPLGSRRLGAEQLFDLRVEKVFRPGAGGHRIGVFADLRNLFNAGTVIDVQDRVPTRFAPGLGRSLPFEAPISLTPPRQVTLGARWTF